MNVRTRTRNYIYRSDFIENGIEIGFTEDEIEETLNYLDFCNSESETLYHSDTGILWGEDANIVQVIIDRIFEDEQENFKFITMEWY